LDFSRQDAINQTRFISARIIWERDRDLAKSTVNQIYSAQQHFRPDANYAPFVYRVVLQIMGFVMAEHVAALTRPLRRLKSDVGDGAGGRR
jgi:hypothetical protein